MQEFTFDVSAEEMADGGQFTRRLLSATSERPARQARHQPIPMDDNEITAVERAVASPALVLRLSLRGAARAASFDRRR